MRTCTLMFASSSSRTSAVYMPPRKSAVTAVATIRRLCMPQRTRVVEPRSPATLISSHCLNLSEELIRAITAGLMQRVCQEENRRRYGHDVRVRYRHTIGYTHHTFLVFMHLRTAICEAKSSHPTTTYVFTGTFRRESDGRSGTRAEDPHLSQ